MYMKVEVVLFKQSSTPEVRFYRDANLSAKPVRLGDPGREIRQTKVYADIQDHSQLITEMDLSGWTEKFIFSRSDGATST